MDFPAYRILKNGKSAYRINSADSFYEITLVGKRYQEHEFKATILPEFVFIDDLLSGLDGTYKAVSETEFFTWVRNTKENYRAL